MGEYFIVATLSDDPASRARSRELADLALREGFTVTDLAATAWLAVGGPHPPATRRIGAWTLVGDVLTRHRPRFLPDRPGDPWDYERKMLARLWGRFIGVRFGPDRRLDAVLRDPSGALDGVLWEQDGLVLVASRARDWWLERLRPHWRIDVDRLAQALHDPLGGGGGLLLEGPVGLLPGTVQPLPLALPAEPLWTPALIAGRSLEAEPSPDAARARLRAALDEAVAGFAGLAGPLAAEVSGGLDSSLVAASLVRTAAAPMFAWLNAWGDTPESDERLPARAVGQALGFAPTCVPHVTRRLTPAALLEATAAFRPNVAVLDMAHDQAWAEHIEAAGATALMTGKGGDSIFVQAPSADVFVDLWRRKGWAALRSPDMAELAASNEISLWTMVAAARRHRLHGHRAPSWSHPVLTPLARPPEPHPWLRDLEAFGPAKAFQIAGVADSVSHNSPTALTDRIDVRHPLGAQPVIEACLALPTWVLTTGGRDRGLARTAFRDRLPETVLGRRSKGDMTRLYSRILVDNLPMLRPWLIEGRLAALGLIDPVAADAELTPETLVWRGQYAPLLAVIAFEGWVRNWERRLGPADRPPPAPPGTAPATPGSG